MAGRKKPKGQELLLDPVAGENTVENVEQLETGTKAPSPEPEPEQAVSYRAEVLPALLVVRREPEGPVVGTLSGGDAVTVTGSRDGYAQMKNGLYIRESHIMPF